MLMFLQLVESLKLRVNTKMIYANKGKHFLNDTPKPYQLKLCLRLNNGCFI